MDAANIIFTSAKRRCYVGSDPGKKDPSNPNNRENPLVLESDTDEDDDELDALYEAEGLRGRQRRKRRKKWLPDNIDPILEELPKWQLLQDILVEIEREIIGRPAPPCKLLYSPS
jgi:DNA excision repair protein ERCC-4